MQILVLFDNIPITSDIHNHHVSVRQPPGQPKQRQRTPPLCAADSKSDALRLTALATNYRAARVPFFHSVASSRYWCHVFVRFFLLRFGFLFCMLHLLIPTVAHLMQETFQKVGVSTFVPQFSVSLSRQVTRFYTILRRMHHTSMHADSPCHDGDAP